MKKKIKTELGNKLRRKNSHAQVNRPVTQPTTFYKKLFFATDLPSNHITVLNTKMLRIFLAQKRFFLKAKCISTYII